MSGIANSSVTLGMEPNTTDFEATSFVWKRPQELFEDKLVKICAPMVRYSK